MASCPLLVLMLAMATNPLIWFFAIIGVVNGRGRFSIRTLLIVTTIVAAMLGGLAVLGRAIVAADRAAVKQAYLNGRISLETARNSTGEDVDRWPKPQENTTVTEQ